MIVSDSYPTRLTVGENPCMGYYDLQPDQLLLKFAETLNDKQIHQFLRESLLEPVARGPGLPNRGYLPCGMLWVNVKQQYEPLSKLADELLENYAGQVIMVSPVYYADGQGPRSAAVPMPQSLIVRFRQGAEEEGKILLAKQFHLKYDDHASRWLGRFHKFWLGPVEDTHTGQYTGEPSKTFSVLNAISRNPVVDIAELNWLTLEAFATPQCDQLWDDPDPAVDWGGQWSMRQINMGEAWEEQTGHGSMIIAVLDTGFDLDHPDLQFTPVSTHYNAYTAIELHEDPQLSHKNIN